jgi:putative endonuclease
MGDYYVYIMTNKSRTLHTGVTNDLERRVFEHKSKLIRGFTSKYNITKLVWFEAFHEAIQAIEGEKKIKGWLRSKKIARSQQPPMERFGGGLGHDRGVARYRRSFGRLGSLRMTPTDQSAKQ